ncbi:hypothetical protein J6590_029201 [Homalodisca vitripennis]|nr:hypothetical protein J6590_029201 [Homalodisca vitripennis]
MVRILPVRGGGAHKRLRELPQGPPGGSRPPGTRVVLIPNSWSIYHSGDKIEDTFVVVMFKLVVLRGRQWAAGWSADKDAEV